MNQIGKPVTRQGIDILDRVQPPDYTRLIEDGTWEWLPGGFAFTSLEANALTVLATAIHTGYLSE